MKRVLIVDDERDLVESLAIALEADFEIRTAHDGREALAVIEREPIDAIVLDLMMPVMSGEELIAELARRVLRIPVIVASASKNVAARCAELGVEHCLQKPYRLARLLERLHALTSSRS
ncbi:MAG TPA: response regulator [Kofleriaceae bacterium]|nr:response regulator [Kofleriaceae bacterium]